MKNKPTLSRTTKLMLITSLSIVFMLMGTVQITEASMQEPAVKGKVTDTYTGGALEGVTVQVEGSETKVVTDKEGNYTIAELPRRSKSITMRFAGYQTVSIDIDDRKVINVSMSQAWEDPDLW